MRPILAALAVLLPAAAHAQTPPPCPTAMGVVDRTAGPTAIYLPADPARPEACRIVLAGSLGEYWYGSWKTDWPGADDALKAIRRVYAGGSGTTEKFDTVAAPGFAWHETIRHDGVEDLNMAGAIRRTIKVTHERQGFGGNSYHSIITQWKDMETNMTIYQNYIHIAGRPEPYTSWDAVSIVGGR